jgi:hypothetical protein
VGPRASLDTQARGKILLPLLGIEPWSSGCPARSQTLHWLATWLNFTGAYIHIYYIPWIHHNHTIHI